MGNIKPAVIKKIARKLFLDNPKAFSRDFNSNKKVLGDSMANKKSRNLTAGHITRLVKRSNAGH